MRLNIALDKHHTNVGNTKKKKEPMLYSIDLMHFFIIFIHNEVGSA